MGHNMLTYSLNGGVQFTMRTLVASCTVASCDILKFFLPFKGIECTLLLHKMFP